MWIAISHCEQRLSSVCGEGVRRIHSLWSSLSELGLFFSQANLFMVKTPTKCNVNLQSSKKAIFGQQISCSDKVWTCEKGAKIFLKICRHIINDRVGKNWFRVRFASLQVLQVHVYWLNSHGNLFWGKNKASCNTAKGQIHCIVFGCPFHLFLRSNIQLKVYIK